MYYLLTVMVLFSLALLLYHAHIKLKITYKRTEDNDIVILIVSTGFGIIKYKIELPFLDFVKKIDSFVIRLKIRFKSGKEIHKQLDLKRAKTMDEFLKKVDHIIDMYHENEKTIGYMAKKIYINDFSLDMRLGFDDAYITGISCGILYTVLVNLLAFLKGYVNLKIKAIDLSPVFNKDVFDLELNCIIHIKLGHIITALKMFIKTSRGSEIDGTTYSRTYENNYGKY